MTFLSARTSRTLACILLAAALWAPPVAFGEEMAALPGMVGPPPEMAGPPRPPADREDAANMLDTPRNYLSGKLVGLVSGVDRFFGDDRHYQETNDSTFLLNVD